MISSRQEIADLLRDKGYRPTSQRYLIYEGMWQAGSHPTAKDVHEFVKKIDPSISLATVYKTLQLFAEIGIVSELNVGDGFVRYDPDTGYHVHLFCTDCETISDLPYENLENIIADIERKTDFDAEAWRFELIGHCKDCKK